MKSAKNGSVTAFIINNEIKQLRYGTENETKIDLTRCHTLGAGSYPQSFSIHLHIKN